MKIRFFLFAIITLVSLSARAQSHSPEVKGYLERGEAMLRDRNYAGLDHQMKELSRLNPSAAQTEDARRLSAIAAIHLPGMPDALALINSWLADYPGSVYYPEMLALKGDYYFFSGEYYTAILIYESINRSQFDTALASDITYRLAYAKMMLGESSEAAKLFATLFGNKQWSPTANFYSGYLSYSDGNYVQALNYFDKVPNNTELSVAADYYTAQIYFTDGQYEKALSISQKLIKDNPIEEYYGEICRIAGESLYNLGREEDAVPYLLKYVGTTANPSPSAMYILGVGEYKDGDYTSAINHLVKVAREDNAMGQSANLYIGQAYVNLNKIDAALMCFEKAYRMGYDRQVAESALYNYAVAKSEGGKIPFSNSVTLFEDFLRQYPDSRYATQVREYMISGYMSDNDYSQALRIIESVKNPDSEIMKAKQECLFVLGTREYNTGDLSTALTRFRQAALIANGDKNISRQCLLWQGTCQYDLGKYSDAVKSLQSYIESASSRDENLALARYDLGYARFAQHDYKAAYTDFRQVIDLNPERKMLADAYNRAADCLYYQSDFAGAETLYKKSFDTNPSEGDYAMFQQAVMKGLRRDHAGKIKALDDMIDRFPASTLIPAAILEKAESYSATGNTQAAIENYRALLKNFAETSYGRNGALQLAITYQSVGHNDEAIETYRHIITSYPSSEEAKLAAEDLKLIYADNGRLREFQQFLNSIPGAPSMDASEVEALTFRKAESEYINRHSIELVESYLREYPRGVYRPQALYMVAEARMDNGDIDKAYDYACDIVKGYPDSDVAVDALLIKAMAEENKGKTAEALHSYQLLDTRATGAKMTGKARLGILRAATDLKQYDTALEVSERLKASTGLGLNEQKETSYLHAVALYGAGRKNEAMTQWEALAKTPENIFGSKAAVALAEAQLSSGRAADAEKTADAFISSNPPHQYWLARGFIVLSDALRAQGNTFEADEYLRSLRTNYPGNEKDIFEMIDRRLK